MAARIALPGVQLGPTAGRSKARGPAIPAPPALAISWLATAMLFVAAAVSLYLVQVSWLATGGYQLQRLQADRDGWVARNQQLELELAKRRSLPWVEAQAFERLGMARAERSAYVSMPLPRSGPSGERKAPSRTDPGDPAPAIDSARDWLVLVTSR